MEMYARRKEWDIGPVEVTVDMEYEGPVPRTFNVAVDLPAELGEDQRQRLLAVAARCPVHKILAGEATVTVVERLAPA